MVVWEKSIQQQVSYSLVRQRSITTYKLLSPHKTIPQIKIPTIIMMNKCCSSKLGLILYNQV